MKLTGCLFHYSKYQRSGAFDVRTVTRWESVGEAPHRAYRLVLRDGGTVVLEPDEFWQFEKKLAAVEAVALIDVMKVEGWVPITPERQPYTVDLWQLKTGLLEAGFTIVDTPVFHMADGRSCCVKTRRIKADLVATDKPEDLPNINPQLMPLLLEQLKRDQATHVYQVMVARTPLFGYLPPTVSFFVRSAGVRPLEAHV